MAGILRWRSHASVVALVALSVLVLARVVDVVRSFAGVSALTPSEALQVGALSGGGSVLVAMALLVGSCFASPTVRARRGLAVWGAVLSAVLLVLGVAGLVPGAGSLAPGTAVFGVVVALAPLSVPFLTTAGLVAAAAAPGPIVATEPLPTPVETATAAASEPEPDPEQQPTWPTDAAAGTVWRSAGDAARGVPGGSWRPAEGAAQRPTWGRPAQDRPALGTGRDDPAGPLADRGSPSSEH